MTPIRWPSGLDPFSSLRYMARELERMVGRSLAGEMQGVGGGAYPPVNVLNGPNDTIVQCELAGVARDDLDISITGETLVIKGTKKPPADEEATVNRIVQLGKEQATRIEDMLAALKAGDMAKVNKLTKEGDASDSESKALFRKIGITECNKN